jgi:hypothetical protein
MKIEPKLMTRAQMERVVDWLTAPACEPAQALSRDDAAAVFAMILGHLAVVTDRVAADVDVQAIPVPL